MLQSCFLFWPCFQIFAQFINFGRNKSVESGGGHKKNFTFFPHNLKFNEHSTDNIPRNQLNNKPCLFRGEIAITAS